VIGEPGGEGEREGNGGMEPDMTGGEIMGREGWFMITGGGTIAGGRGGGVIDVVGVLL
jgi:hypothetical protein